ncbi:putative neural-cadherin 2 [Penaeus chinensis]|uniref:putative neural-cadherin 2 n=1 Tax=Penaeus chinensis TaxID=139456 RepID=UPI001FB5A0EE|nr:putative neural-cadherin 2 [Penaeus chinensis]
MVVMKITVNTMMKVKSGGDEGRSTHSIVQVTVTDVNDNAPEFLESNLVVSVVEEDDRSLPAVIAKVEARDVDTVDRDGLLYTLSGDGVDGHGTYSAFFTISPNTGEILQHRALDRDPPHGRPTWKLKVQVRDGQHDPSSRYARTSSAANASSHVHVRRALRPESQRLHPHSSAKPEGETPLHGDGGRSKGQALPFRDVSRSRTPRLHPLSSEAELSLPVARKRKKEHSPEGLAVPKDVPPPAGHSENKRRNRTRRKPDEEEIDRLEEVHERRLKHESDSPSPPRHAPSRHKSESRAQHARYAGLRIASKEAEGVFLNTRTRTNPGGSETMVIGYQAEVGTLRQSSLRRSPPSLKDEKTRRRRRNPPKNAKSKWIFISDNGTTPTQKRLRKRGSGRPWLPLGLSPEAQTALNLGNISFPGRKTFPKIYRSVPGRRGKVRRSITGGNAGEERKGLDGKMREKENSRRENHKREKAQDATDEGRDGGGCQDYGVYSLATDGEEPKVLLGTTAGGRTSSGGGRVHVVETVVTVVVKDINDNAPVFPNSTMYGEVQENGPIHLRVAVVSAWDADDEAEGTNARLTYSIAKNVVDERSGQAIFTVDPQTGLVKTAICCLDRETTPEYHIQVVATDGGGLKGSGTVVVRLDDVNDNAPRLTRELWEAEVEETWGAGPPRDDTLLEITTDDRDTSNYFFYRVVEASGWGWDHFAIRTVATCGELYAVKTLDYEDASHRRGFKFMVQVTDRGRGGWDDARHTDTAWISIRLKDVNDNPPEFRRSLVHITVREDTAPGTLLASMPARDPDMEGRQRVEYRIVGGWGALSVEAGGGVRLWRALDREGEGGAEGVARVVGVDEGRPPLSSTATLSITVTDVNDCPPRLLPPTVLHVREGTSAARLGVLTATDDDVWEMGHGPPFALALAASNPAHVLDLIALKFDASE